MDERIGKQLKKVNIKTVEDLKLLMEYEKLKLFEKISDDLHEIKWWCAINTRKDR